MARKQVGRAVSTSVDDIERIALRVAGIRGWQTQVTGTGPSIAWVEFAVETSGGHCPHHDDVRTGPAWQVIDSTLDGPVGLRTSGACGVDGELDAGWHRSGAAHVTSRVEVLELAQRFVVEEIAIRDTARTAGVQGARTRGHCETSAVKPRQPTRPQVLPSGVRRR